MPVTTTDALVGVTQNNTTVSYCDFNSVGAASKGVRIDSGNTVTVANNTFTNDGNGVYLGGGYLATVRNINITGARSPRWEQMPTS